MKVKTIKSAEVWKAKDGNMKIFEVTLEADGKEYELKTYSEKIAVIGFEGDVQSYTNNRGDKFVKQVPKQGGGFKGQPRDDAAIRAQWAIGQAYSNQPDGAKPEDIEKTAKMLYAMVDRVKGSNDQKIDSFDLDNLPY